jgi:hypothetical protein
MVRRKLNEVELLRTIAGTLEMIPWRDVAPEGEQTAAQASVKDVIRRVRAVAERRFVNEPTVWRPPSYILREAEARLKPAQLKAKRADTLLRHVIAALRAEADARSAS